MPGVPPAFAGSEDHFPTEGLALDVACGPGVGAIWLAGRGMDVWGVDVSPVAIATARDLATRWHVEDRCRFDEVDLDDGLPDGPQVDVILCHLFRGEGLARPMICVPIRLREKGVGVLRVFIEEGRPASPRTAEILAAAFSAAVRNVLLYRSLLQSIEEVAEARRLSRR